MTPTRLCCPQLNHMDRIDIAGGLGEEVAKVKIKLLGSWSAWSEQVRWGNLVRPDGSSAPVLLRALPQVRFSEALAEDSRCLAALCHPAVLRLYHITGVGSDIAIVYEHFEGVALSRVLAELGRRSRHLPVRATAEIAAQVCDALLAAEQVRQPGAAVVHPGPCPAEVLVDETGQVKVAGFAVHRQGSPLLLAPPGYVPPEGCAAPGAWAYGVGALLVELLSGERPSASAADPSRHEAMIRRALIRVLARSGEPAPEATINLIRQCMARQPEARPALEDVRDRLVALADSLRSPRLRTWAPGSVPAILQMHQPPRSGPLPVPRGPRPAPQPESLPISTGPADVAEEGERTSPTSGSLALPEPPTEETSVSGMPLPPQVVIGRRELTDEVALLWQPSRWPRRLGMLLAVGAGLVLVRMVWMVLTIDTAPQTPGQPPPEVASAHAEVEAAAEADAAAQVAAAEVAAAEVAAAELAAAEAATVEASSDEAAAAVAAAEAAAAATTAAEGTAAAVTAAAEGTAAAATTAAAVAAEAAAAEVAAEAAAAEVAAAVAAAEVVAADGAPGAVAAGVTAPQEDSVEIVPRIAASTELSPAPEGASVAAVEEGPSASGEGAPAAVTAQAAPSRFRVEFRVADPAVRELQVRCHVGSGRGRPPVVIPAAGRGPCKVIALRGEERLVTSVSLTSEKVWDCFDEGQRACR